MTGRLSFAYAPLQISRGKTTDDGVTVKTVLTNTGAMAGDEVAQLYLQFPKVPSVPRIALRGIQRVHLTPGESRQLEFGLSPRHLSSVSKKGERRVAAGLYQVSVGGNQPGKGASVSVASVRIARDMKIAK